jgi:hypothetical protein
MQPLICLGIMTGAVMIIIPAGITVLSEDHISFWEKLAGFCSFKIIKNGNQYVPGDALLQCNASLFLCNEYKAQQKEFYFHSIASKKTPHSLISLNRDVCNKIYVCGQPHLPLSFSCSPAHLLLDKLQ